MLTHTQGTYIYTSSPPLLHHTCQSCQSPISQPSHIPYALTILPCDPITTHHDPSLPHPLSTPQSPSGYPPRNYPYRYSTSSTCVPPRPRPHPRDQMPST